MRKKLPSGLQNDERWLEALRIAAGFVRNLVWDKLHDYCIDTPLSDVDLIYFDSSQPSEDQNRPIETRLLSALNHL